MNIIRYIQGIRKGREINRIEREAMEDPFLSDALEGYDKVRGDHEIRIKKMQNKISAQTRPSNHAFRYWAVAASILLLIGIGGSYFLWDELKQPETILVAESAPIQLDTTSLEDLADNSPEAEYAPKDYSDNYDKRPEVMKAEVAENLISDNQQYEGIDIRDFAEHKVIVEAEKMALKADTTTIPQPTVGIQAYDEYLKTQLDRPMDEECKDITGYVTLSFSIDKNGRPYDIRVIKSLCPLADWEAMRLVKGGPAWTTSESIATVNVYF